MTTEREAMSLEQMRSHLLHRCEMLDGTDEVTFDRSELLIFVDAIEGYLSRTAEPVGEVQVFNKGGECNWRLYDYDLCPQLSVGTHKLYTAPPAQAQPTKESRDDH